MNINESNVFERIAENANLYWPEFQLVAVALYDQNGVYLYNHPKFLSTDKPYSFLKWNNEFNGINTLILYEGYPTAIVNLDYYNEMESVYSIMVHELFHGFQYLKEENRFPDELAGMNYPMKKENIELRNRERRYLYQAGISTRREEKLDNMKKFVELRESRRKFIDQYLDFELFVETVEGPAFYVEFQACLHNSNHSYEELLETFSKGLIENKESSQFLRRSCYRSGFVICCLLDEFFSDWKEGFFTEEMTLYDILKEKVKHQYNEIKHFDISSETTAIIEEINSERKDMFTQFEHKEGYHLYLIGDMERAAFDPMNALVGKQREMHQNFIKILLNGREYVINQPVIAYYNSFNKLDKLHIVLPDKPVNKNGNVSIIGIGDMKGKLSEKDGSYYFRAD